VIKIDKSAQPAGGGVTITGPESGTVIREITAKGRYETVTPESEGHYYIDGEYAGSTKDAGFDFDAIGYAEGSRHTVSVISRDTDGVLHYSQGMYSLMLLSDSFANEEWTGSKNNVTYSENGAVLSQGGSGEIITKEVTSPKNIQALRLTVTEEIPEGAGIEYRYSTDGGRSFQTIVPGEDVLITEAVTRVQVKAVFTGGSTPAPRLYGWSIVCCPAHNS